MLTEVNVVDLPLKGGKKIKAHEYKARNFRLQKGQYILSKLQVLAQEKDSSNSYTGSKARETRNFWIGWGNFKQALRRASKYKDAPQGVVELEFDILIPTMESIKEMRNAKFQSISEEFYFLQAVLVSLDSNNMQTWLEPSDEEELWEAVRVVEEIMYETIGSGEKEGDADPDTGVTQYNGGAQVANFSQVGRLVPSLDNDAARYEEPSRAAPMRGHDAADVD